MRAGGLFWLLVRRDLSLAVARPGQWLLPMLFFLLVAILVPFAVGPERELLARLAPGMVWIAALLASLLPVATLYAGDHADGTLDQYAVRGIAGESLAAARIAALWLGFAGPLLVALPLLGLLLSLPFADLPLLALALAIGSLGLAALANIAAALTIGARGGGGLVALVVLPLALPLLIFGSRPADAGALRLLAATTLLLVAAAPFACAAAMRAARG